MLLNQALWPVSGDVRTTTANSFTSYVVSVCCTQVAHLLRCICVLYTSTCTVVNTTDDKKKELDGTLE